MSRFICLGRPIWNFSDHSTAAHSITPKLRLRVPVPTQFLQMMADAGLCTVFGCKCRLPGIDHSESLVGEKAPGMFVRENTMVNVVQILLGDNAGGELKRTLTSKWKDAE